MGLVGAAMDCDASTGAFSAKIVYLGEVDEAGGRWAAGREHLVQLARAVSRASGGGCEVELLACGVHPGREALFPGVVRRTVAAGGRWKDPLDAVSWELVPALEEADLVHIHGCQSRTCEAGLLIACQARVKVCISQYDVVPRRLAGQLGLLDLADAVICHSKSIAAALDTRARVDVLEEPVDPAWFDLDRTEQEEARDPDALERAAGEDGGGCEGVDYAALGERTLGVYRRVLSGREAA